MMKQGEGGFTLIEMVMVIAIAALIAGAAAMVTFQIVKGTERSNDHMTAINQVQNAGYWISRDAQMAENVTADGLIPPNFLILSWVEEESDDQYQVIYTLEAMPGSELKKLQRHLSINGESDTTLVARYIDPDPGRTKCELLLDGRLVLTVTANVSTHSQTRVYEVVPRPN
ncbi:hypothetical protein ES703_67912 [subsurface metagenome]